MYSNNITDKYDPASPYSNVPANPINHHEELLWLQGIINTEIHETAADFITETELDILGKYRVTYYDESFWSVEIVDENENQLFTDTWTTFVLKATAHKYHIDSNRSEGEREFVKFANRKAS